MQYQSLGNTGIEVSRLAFGAGPIPALMTGDDDGRQNQILQHAIDSGINWIDTAATYGNGNSETSIGRALQKLGDPSHVQLATKVRLFPEDLADMAGHIRRSVESSLKRLQRPKVTLLQLHNSVTNNRGDEATSITPDDVLHNGVLAAMQQLQREGLVDFLGLTGIGHPHALREVINSGEFQTIQIPFNLVNPSAAFDFPESFVETSYGNVVADCVRNGMGVFAIRVYAGGALLGAEPAKHTYTTKFFPLDLYRRDCAKAAELAGRLTHGLSIQSAAIRFVTGNPQFTSAIVGFSETDHIDEAISACEAGPLPDSLVQEILPDL